VRSAEHIDVDQRSPGLVWFSRRRPNVSFGSFSTEMVKAEARTLSASPPIATVSHQNEVADIVSMLEARETAQA